MKWAKVRLLRQLAAASYQSCWRENEPKLGHDALDSLHLVEVGGELIVSVIERINAGTEEVIRCGVERKASAL